MFKKAERKQAKLRLALSGPSGSGKTTGALLIAKGLGGRVAVLDTERGSASLYDDLCEFDVVELGPPYTPERYIEIIQAAEKEGYSTLVLDSITHEWNGSGGILEIVDNMARAKFKGNSYAAWSEGTPRHQKFIDAMLASPMHIIATMRSKAVYVETEKGNGKKTMEKQGAAPQQRDGLEYEFTAVLDLSVDKNLANASKDRTRLFREPFVISEQTGTALLNWLNSGIAPPPPPQRLSLGNVDRQFEDCATVGELDAALKALGINRDHPDAPGVAELYKAHKTRIEEDLGPAFPSVPNPDNPF